MPGAEGGIRPRCPRRGELPRPLAPKRAARLLQGTFRRTPRLSSRSRTSHEHTGSLPGGCTVRPTRSLTAPARSSPRGRRPPRRMPGKAGPRLDRHFRDDSGATRADSSHQSRSQSARPPPSALPAALLAMTSMIQAGRTYYFYREKKTGRGVSLISLKKKTMVNSHFSYLKV